MANSTSYSVGKSAAPKEVTRDTEFGVYFEISPHVKKNDTVTVQFSTIDVNGSSINVGLYVVGGTNNSLDYKNEPHPPKGYIATVKFKTDTPNQVRVQLKIDNSSGVSTDTTGVIAIK